MRGVHCQPSTVYRLLSSVAGLAMVMAGAGCGLEGPVINRATQDKSTLLPQAADNVVLGAVEGAPDGTLVEATLATGEALDGIAGIVLGNGFEVRFPGNTEYTGVVLDSRWTGGQALAIVPNLPRQLSVLDPDRIIDLALAAPGMSPLSARSTAFSLVLWGKALSAGNAPASLSPEVIRSSAAALAGGLATHNAAIETFVDTVRTLLAKAGQGGVWPFPGVPSHGNSVEDMVDSNYLELNFPEMSPESFALSLLEAAAEVDIQVCHSNDRIRTVFLTAMTPGSLDGNCNEADPFKWASDAPGKTLYFTGGIHESTPVCGKNAEPPACLDDSTVDAANQKLGNWAPNLVQMFDDGSRGDAVKGDGIYTLSLELPYVPAVSTGTGGPGVRIGYKYSWGLPGDGWTGTEEWPGNQRILELVDGNGDGIVTRMDVFGDEASNKDKANSLTLKNGGCGVNFWEDEIKAGCGHDTRENQVDLDGDCSPDAWPQPGSASPISGNCLN